MYGKGTWVNARAMRAHGMSYVEIGVALGIDRRTVKKLCMMEDIPEPEARERSSIIDPFAEVIDAWLEKRPSLKASVIAAQLEPLGYAGSYAAEKIAEYALAVVSGKKPCLHAGFVMDVSPCCDCWGYNDKALVADIGIAASSDPVALDRACVDMVDAAPVVPGTVLEDRRVEGGDKFGAANPNTSWQAGLAYAESIGLGSQAYELVTVA